MKYLMRLLREPLFHFLVIGGLIFLIFTVVSGPTSEPIDIIVIEPERIQQLAAGYEGVWRRPPSEDEMRTLIGEFVREEIYYREALALGLDRNDTIIRRRLQQKMEFLTDTGADLIQPASGELEAWFAVHREVFRRLPELAFEQIFMGEDPATAHIKTALDAIRSNPEADPSRWSEHSLLPAKLGLSPPDAIDGVFGENFFDQLAQIPAGEWAGPVRSSYGLHLARINERLPGRLPDLEEVHDAVLRNWKAVKALELRDLHYARLKERYVVNMPQTETPNTQSR